MIRYPQTPDEARAVRYGRWAGNEQGNPYDETHCAMNAGVYTDMSADEYQKERMND